MKAVVIIDDFQVPFHMRFKTIPIDVIIPTTLFPEILIEILNAFFVLGFSRTEGGIFSAIFPFVEVATVVVLVGRSAVIALAHLDGR